jgi:hypothetical protein
MEKETVQDMPWLMLNSLPGTKGRKQPPESVNAEVETV